MTARHAPIGPGANSTIKSEIPVVEPRNVVLLNRNFAGLKTEDAKVEHTRQNVNDDANGIVQVAYPLSAWPASLPPYLEITTRLCK